MAAKGSLESIIEIAKKELGTIEGPKDNETKYGAWIKVNFQPWCQSFVSWCAFTAGVKSFPKSASTVQASDWFKKNERWSDARNDDPTPGDWIYFDFPEDGVNRISHVGLCVKNNGDGTIQVIEGNTSGTSKGDQRNGGMCVEKTRAYVKNNKPKLINAVVGWGRPVYTGEENVPLLNKLGADSVDTGKAVPLTYCPSLGRNVPTSGYPSNCPGASSTSDSTKVDTGAVVPLTYCPSLGRNVPTSGFPGNCPGAAPAKKAVAKKAVAKKPVAKKVK